MQLFWSWQAGTPVDIGRDLIRSALDAAVKQADEAAPPHIVEPTGRDGEPDRLRHDKSELGHLDAGRAILEQIGQSVAFVADVTPFAGAGSPKASPSVNPDVSVELGCALGVLGNERTLLILNEHYAKLTDLPFQIREKERLITFNLPPSADKQEIQATRRHLSIELADFVKSALIKRSLEDKDLSPLVKRAERLILTVRTLVIGAVGLFSFKPVLESLQSSLKTLTITIDHPIWKLTFWIYFTSWILGVAFDTKREDDVFVAGVQYGGKIHVKDTIMLVGIAAVFFIIACVEQTREQTSDVYRIYEDLFPSDMITNVRDFYNKYGTIFFLCLMNFLWALNVILWRVFLRDYIDSMVSKSREALERHHFFANLDKLYSVQAYIKGYWQWRRFAIGAAWLVALDLFVVYTIATRGVDGLNQSTTFFILMFAFVVVVEAWVWIERGKMWCHQTSADHIENRYWLIPKVARDDSFGQWVASRRNLGGRRRKQSR